MPKSRHNRRRADGSIARRRTPHPLAVAYREIDQDDGESLNRLLLDLIDDGHADAEIDKAAADLEPDEAADLLAHARDLAHDVEMDVVLETDEAADAIGTLFAVAISGPVEALSAFEGDQQLFGRLGRSFGHAGIVAKNSAVVLWPRALHPRDLLAWRVRDIQFAAASLAEAAAQNAPAELPEPLRGDGDADGAAEEAPDEIALVSHRILLGLRLFVGEEDVGDAIEGAPQDDDEAAAFETALANWMRAANEELVSSGIRVVGTPSPVDDALADVAASAATQGLLSRFAAAGGSPDEERADRIRHIRVSADLENEALHIHADSAGGCEAAVVVPYPLVRLRTAEFLDRLEDAAEEALTIDGED